MLFGDVWERSELSKRDRSLATVAALLALNRPDQLRFHLNFAVQNGVKKEELVEMITHLAFYSGWPNAMSAIMVAKEVLLGGGGTAAQYGRAPELILVWIPSKMGSVLMSLRFFTIPCV